MKKLMIAAAAAAMIGSAQAYEAQVYDMTLTVKTTQCKETKVSAALEAYLEDDANSSATTIAATKGDKIGLRKQATRKMAGVIWGCDCETIAYPAWRTYRTTKKTVGGYVFWDLSSKEHFYIPKTAFFWTVLNRIDAMTKVEGSWVLANGVDGSAFWFAGAGFGSVKGADCSSYISSMSGNFAGFRQAVGGTTDCFFCEDVDTDCLAETFCYDCSANADTTELTAAYGTWKLKYNKSASKKLRTKGRITESYSSNSFNKVNNLVKILDAIEDFYYNDLASDEDCDEEHSELVDVTEATDYAYAKVVGTCEDGECEFDEDDLYPSFEPENEYALGMIEAALEGMEAEEGGAEDAS
jgi:hypothetical protein